MDSGVETGNESNDSSATQLNHAHHSTPFGGVGNQSHLINGNMEDDSSSNTATLTDIESHDCSEYNDDTSKNSLIKYYSEPVTSKSIVDRAKSSTSGLVFELHIPPEYKYSEYKTPMEDFNRNSYNKLKMQQRMDNLLRRHRLSAYSITRESMSNDKKVQLAVKTNNVELLQRLLNKNVSLNKPDVFGRTPLHLAAYRGYTEIVSLLLAHGANPNCHDYVHKTPLHLAAVRNNISVVTLLLMAGANVLSLDSRGYNPLQVAQIKLRDLHNDRGQNPDMNRIKDEVRKVIGMLLAYLQKQNDSSEQIEALSTFCSRLSLSNTAEKIQDDVRDLLASVNSLKLNN